MVVPNAAYPLAVGGAGAGDVVEPIMDEIIHKAADEKPSTQKDLLSMLRSAVNFVFENEISALVLSRQQRVTAVLGRCETECGLRARFFVRLICSNWMAKICDANQSS